MPKGLSKSEQPGFEETDPFFLWAEEAWIKPCTAKMPKLMHGFCTFGPAFAFVAVLLGIVAMLAWCENRNKAKAAPPSAKKEGKKKKN